MRRKFLLMTFLTLLFTAMGTSVLRAQGNVAKVGNTEYAKLADAVNAAQADDEIKVIANIATNLDLTISKKVTLDLGGFTLSDAGIIIASDVTIKNGKIVNTNESYPLKVTGSGNLTVDGVAIEASKSDRAIWLDGSSSVLNFKSGSSILATKGTNNTKSTIYGVWVAKGATANIYGGTITVDAGADATAVAIFGNYVNTVNIYGGKISTSGKYYSYAVWVDGDVTITGGEIVTNEKQYGYSSGITYGYNYAINSKGNVEISGDTKITTYGPKGYIVNAGGSNQEVVITGGEFTNVLSEVDKTAGGHSAPNLIYGSSVDATIEGGDFNGYKGEELIKGTGSTLTITGGSFDNKPKDDYVEVGATITVGETTYTKTEDGLEVVIPVASVNGTSYTDLQEAIKAAAPSGTVEILSDVTVDEWIMFSETLNIGSGQIITMNINGLTINGNDKTVTINSIESAGNGGYLIFDATKLNVKDLTIKYADGLVGGIGLKSGTINNVTFIGGNYGVFPGASGVTIENCKFNGTKSSAVYYEEGRQGIVVKNNSFNTADGAYAITMRSNEQFTGNTITKGKVNIANSSSATVTGNNFGQERFKVYNAATATIEDNEINILAFNDESVVFSTFGENTLSTEAQVVLNGASFPVAQIGTTKYGTLADALSAASAMIGDVTVEIYEKVTLNQPLAGSYSSIKFVGKDTDAEIYLDVQGYITATGKEVAFEGLTLSKSLGGHITNAGFMNVAFGVYDVTKVTYTNCTFANGAYASSGNVTYTGCTFKRSHDKYGLWAYGNVDVTVDNCIFADYRGIKMYAEGAAKTVDLTVKNTNFSAVTDKPAIVLTYGEKVTLEGNTYSETGTFELDLDGAPNGTTVTSDVDPICINDNGACGVLVNDKIYTTVAQAAEVATPGSTVTLLHDSAETVVLPMGVTLNKNGYEAAGVTVAEPIAKIGEVGYTSLAEAVAAVQEGQTIQLLAGEISEGTIKLPATLKNVTFKGAANHASVLKDMTIMAADGNSFNYEGLTFDGIQFDNSRILFTGWRNGEETIEDLKITNCFVENLYDGTNMAFLHINKEASEPVKNLTFTNNVLNGVTGGAKSGIYSVNTGNVIIKGNTFNNIVFRPALVQLSDCDDIVDNVDISNNVISNTTRLQVYGTEVDNGDGTYTPTGTDELEVKINNNIFKNISGYYICTWGINGDYDISKNYYDSDNLSEKIYWNNEKPSTVSGLYELGVYPVYTELNADGTINTESEYTPDIPFAQIGETGYPSLEAAAAAAQAGDEILLLANVTLSEELTTPPGITLNGNGKQINGTINAGGALTIKGRTKVTNFGAGSGDVITIGEGACLEINGTGRMVIGHGATFNITGNITDAKNANVADLTPSLIMPGASFTGAGVTFNVTNAYINAPSSYCSSSKSASGTFVFKFDNSIWESAGKLAFESQSTAATVNFELKDSKLTTGSHLVFGVSRGEVVFDNSHVNVGTSRQIENQSTMTVKNGSVVNGAVATSSNAKNPGTLIVDNATYDVEGEFSGSDLGTGTLIIKKGANVSVGSIKAGANVVVDAEGMAAGDNINFTADLSQFTGTLSVINNDNLEAKIVDGKIILVVKPVAKIGETEYATLQAALQAAAETEELTTIHLLAGTHTFGNVKFPATLKNVTIVGADNKATIIKDSKLYSADGNAVTYKGITFDGIVFDNSSILFTGARNGEVVYEDWTIKNCDFRNLQSTDGIAAIHFNLAADETIKNFTFEDNTITNVTSPSNTASGLRLNYVTGNVVIKDNETNDVAFNAVQIINSVVDNFTFEGNILRSNGSSLANLYNVTGENIVITKNQFLVANEDQKGVSNIAYADVSGNYWGGGAPINLPEGVVFSSYYTTVESDGTLGGLVELPQGNNFTGYTGVDAIWGEVWGNAKVSFVVKVLDANGNVMGTTSLNNIGGIIDGDVNVTWSLKLDAASNTDEYWTMEWTTAPKINNMPEINNMPAKVELWVDGVKVSGGDVVLNGPDNLNPIYAAVTDADGKILSYHTSIAAAAQQGNTIALLRDTDEEIKLPFGVTLNLNGFDAPNVTFTLPTAMIGETEYASVADALAAAQAANLADVVITIIGENTAATADNFSLIYENKFDKVTFKQNNGGKVYYFNELYTGSRTNNGEFVFDGVNLVVTGQYMFEGNVKLSNNSFVKSTAEANCFVYYAEVTVEAGSKIDGVIEDIRGGSLIIDGGKTDGTYCSEPGLRDAILTVNWTSSNLVLKNGAYVKVNSANEVGRLTVNGEMRVTDSKLESYQWILVKENATLTLNAGSDITTQEVNGAGNIIVDVTGLEGQATVIKGDMTGFTGTITVNRGFYTVTADGLVVERGLSGKGTEAEPYLINDISDLEFFRDQVNAGNDYAGKYIKLTEDIDLAPTRSGSNWTPIGTDSEPFNGTFDGDNHTISNLVITGYNSNVGFFGRTNNGEIKNVIFENAKVSGRLNVGVVAGTPYTSKYTNIKVKGHVEVNGMAYVGGVGGKNAYANWTDITVDVDDTSYVEANSTENGNNYRTYVGGVIGFNGEGSHTFMNITSNIKVIGNICDIGGIFGIAHYGNNFTNVTCTGNVEAAEGAEEVGGIAGVWNNTHGYTVTMTDCEYKDATITIGDVDVTATNAFVGGAYTPSHETSGTSGSLVINGETVYPYVAKIGEVGYNTLAKAVTAAQDGETIQLLWKEGEAPIAMNASLYGKDVTITGTATVDWSKDFLFVGRGGVGNAKLTFESANLTSASNSASYGIHVSGREKGTNDKYDGTVEIKNSTIELDYLINKGTMTLDNNSTLTVKNGFSVGGRPASETESGQDATATITLNNNSKVVVNNHNGMGLGYEAIGVMNVNSGSTFETTEDFLITAKGTMNVNGGNVKTVGTLTNNGAVNVTGESILDIETLTGEEINFLDGAIIKNSTVGGGVFVKGKVTFRGDNTFAMLYDFGTLTDYYGTTANMEWTVEEGASLTLTNEARYGLGYGDNVTINGSITTALEARENLTEDDRSLFMHGLVAQESKGWNCNSKFTVEDAYVVIGSNNSFGNKPGEYGGNYTINFKNSVVDGSRITFYEASSTTEFTFEDSDVKIGTFMTRDTDSKFTLKNSKVLSTATNNGTDEGNYNAGELTLDKSSLTYSAEFANTGTLNIGESSTFTAPSVVNNDNGAINFTALSAKLYTYTEGLTIVDQVNNPDYKVVYKEGEGAYQFVEKVYVAQIDNGDKFETLIEAVAAVEDGGTITLIANETFTENNRSNNGGWWDGLAYSGDKSFTIDLANFTISQDGALNDYLMWFKNDGAKANTITLKNGTLDAGTTAYCALATASSNAQKITVNLETIKVINNNSNGSTVKVRAGAELNVKAGTEITGKDSYLGIECWAATVNIYDGAKIYMNGTLSYNGCLAGVGGNGTINVYGGEGTSAKGGFIAMTSGGTINVAGGKWIANTDGTVGDNSNLYVLTAQNNKYESGYAGASIINVTGGTFRGGMDAWILNDPNVEKAELNISGGNFNADPSAYVDDDDYEVVPKNDGTFDVIQIAGTQTRSLQAGWNWFSSYVDLSQEGGLLKLQTALGESGLAIKGQTENQSVQYVKIGVVEGEEIYAWTGNQNWNPYSNKMYMIKTSKAMSAEEFGINGDFIDYENATIALFQGWNWISYPLNEPALINEALAELNPTEGDQIKFRGNTYAEYFNGEWYPEDFVFMPGEGYMYKAESPNSFVYTKGTTNVRATNKTDENNNWMAQTSEYANNMTITAMLSIDGEVVNDNYEIAAFANGECRGSARPIYIEKFDAYILFMTVYGEEVEDLTFRYYDVNYGTEYELDNRVVYSNDASLGSIKDPYMFTLNITGVDETSMSEINIYPNPTTIGSEINLQATCDKVEVFNALGVKIAEYQNVDTLDAFETAGIYVIRITNDNAVKHCRLVVK